MTWQDYIKWYQSLSNEDQNSLGWNDQITSLLNSPFAGILGGSSSKFNQSIWDYAKSKYGDDYLGLQGYLTGVHGFTYNPEWESWLNNMISVQNQNSEHDWSQMMRDSDLESTAGQLAELGLNPASVISMQRASAPTMDAAGVDRSDNANSRAQRELQRKENLTNRIFHLLSGMSAAGLGFAALKGPKFIAAKMANSTAKAVKRSFSSGRFTAPSPVKPATVSSRLLYTDSDTWN